MTYLRNLMLVLCAGSLVSCGGADVLEVPASEAYLLNGTIFIELSEGWVNLNKLLGKNLDYVKIIQTMGALEIEEKTYDVWWAKCLQAGATGTSKIRVEERFVSPAKEYWVVCLDHDQGAG